MIPTLSDRHMLGKPMFFEISINELDQEDLNALIAQPKRDILKIKLYHDPKEIPLYRWNNNSGFDVQIHPHLSLQQYIMLKEADGGIIIQFRAKLPSEFDYSRSSFDDMIDELRPPLLYHICEDSGLTIYKLLTHLRDIQYHFEYPTIEIPSTAEIFDHRRSPRYTKAGQKSMN
jgi:hypothetical protein